LEQRDGRILRQGNQNPEVQVIRYSVEQSFDAYSWQTVERKARFIAQVMRGRIDVREMEDVGDTALSFAEAKALASGDPLVLDKATADADLARLERLSRAHHRNLSAVSRRVQQADWQIDRCDTDLAALETAAARTVSTRGTDFHAVVAGTSTADRTDAADLLRDWATTTLAPPGATITREHPHGVITHLGGHDITATELPTARGLRPDVRLCLADVPRSQWQVASTALVKMSSGALRRWKTTPPQSPTWRPGYGANGRPPNRTRPTPGPSCTDRSNTPPTWPPPAPGSRTSTPASPPGGTATSRPRPATTRRQLRSAGGSPRSAPPYRT
jgi:hypothetical protein